MKIDGEAFVKGVQKLYVELNASRRKTGTSP
jgi:hypothetical protein